MCAGQLRAFQPGTRVGSLGFCWCWAGKALQKQGSLSHLGGWVGFLQGGENRIVLGEVTQCTGMKVGTCHTRDFPCVFWLSLSVQSNCLGLPTLLTAKRLSFLPRFCVCEKKTNSKLSRKSEHRYISPEHGRCSYLTPQHSFFFRTHIFPWSHSGSLGRHKTLPLVLMVLAWELAHTWSKDMFCLLLPSAGARIQFFLRTWHRAVIYSIFVILQLFYQRWICQVLQSLERRRETAAQCVSMKCLNNDRFRMNPLPSAELTLCRAQRKRSQYST